jgi:hypothetical protein
MLNSAAAPETAPTRDGISFLEISPALGRPVSVDVGVPKAAVASDAREGVASCEILAQELSVIF